jgi:crossover junction endodeoxyribonuclease RuvC
MICIGIDPGITGSVVFNSDGKLTIEDTPVIEVKKGNHTTHVYNTAGMAEILHRIWGQQPCHVFIESVHSMPKQGVASTFSFGMGFGMWLGIIAAYNLPYTLVTPQAWKKSLMEGIHDKDAARVRAIQLFPTFAKYFERKKDIGRADAALISEFGRRTLK